MIINLTFLVIFLMTMYIVKKYWNVFQVPGSSLPKGIRGNLPDLLANPRQFGPNMTAKHGPVYRIFLSNLLPVILVGDPVLAKELFQAQANMAHTWDLGLGNFVVRFIGDGMGFANGPHWANIRKVFRTALSSSIAESSLSTLKSSLDQWEVEILQPLVRSGKSIQIHEVVGMMPMINMLNIFFGESFVKRNFDQFVHLLHDSHYIQDRNFNGTWSATAIYKFFDTKPNRIMKEFKDLWNKILCSYESSTEREVGNGGIFDTVLDYLTTITKPEAMVSFNQVSDTMIEIIFSNQDVLQPAITWLFTDLILYPQYVNWMDLTGNYDGEMINKATLNKSFKKLQHVVAESARVHPFIPLSSPEVLDQDIKLGSYFLPKGSSMSIDLYSLNHNPEYWSDPSKFQPERFSKIDEFTKNWGMFRFGFGGRRCPGTHFTDLVMANATARLFSKYRLVPVDFVAHHENVPLLSPGIVTMLPDCQVKVQLANNQPTFDRIQPIFYNGSQMKELLAPGVFVGVSIVPSSPLLSASGSSQMVSFLASLPYPSLIFLADSVNRHNFKAMSKLAKRSKMPTDEEALAASLKAGNEFYHYLSTAIQNLEKCQPESHRGQIKLVRWQEIEDKKMKFQQAIIRKHYESSTALKARIDKIALDFLMFRRPTSKKHSTRLPFMVSYILEELPSAIIGLNYEEQHYCTLVYPTTIEKANTPLCNAIWDLVYDIQTCPLFLDLKTEMVEASGGFESTLGVTLLPVEKENDLCLES